MPELSESQKSEIEQDIEWLTSCEKCEGFAKSVGHNYCSNCGRELPDEWSENLGVEEK